MLRSLLFVLAVLCVGFASQSASAQHFSFGISSGHGHRHHHHHHGWHFDWHDCWHDHYYPRYVYVQPAPVVRERVYIEREPRPYDARSYQTTSPAPAADTLITVQNAAGKSVAVTFLMDAQDVSLRDGETRTFTGRSTRVVEFDRGGDYGSARYDLTPGDYEFIVTARGWDLQRKTSAAASTAAKPSVRKNALPTIR
jgi:hypothetical protein